MSYSLLRQHGHHHQSTVDVSQIMCPIHYKGNIYTIISLPRTSTKTPLWKCPKFHKLFTISATLFMNSIAGHHHWLLWMCPKSHTMFTIQVLQTGPSKHMATNVEVSHISQPVHYIGYKITPQTPGHYRPTVDMSQITHPINHIPPATNISVHCESVRNHTPCSLYRPHKHNHTFLPLSVYCGSVPNHTPCPPWMCLKSLPEFTSWTTQLQQVQHLKFPECTVLIL